MDKYSKEILGIKNETVGLAMKSVAFYYAERILEIGESNYRGDKYGFSVQHYHKVEIK